MTENIHRLEEIKYLLRELISAQDDVTHYNVTSAGKVDYEQYLKLMREAQSHRDAIRADITDWFAVILQQRTDAVSALRWAMEWLDLEYDRNHPGVDPEWADNYDAAMRIVEEK